MKINSSLLNGTNINMSNFDTTSMNGGSNFDSESHISFNSVKIKNQNLFPKPVSDSNSQQVLPELSYFTTSMPLMTLNPNNLATFNSTDKSKKLPKLKSNHSNYFKTNSQNFKPISNASNKSGIN